MKSLTIVLTGTNSILLDNPQVADPLLACSQELKTLSKKRNKTVEDIKEIEDVTMKYSVYWNDDFNGVYIPQSHLMASMCKISNEVAKVSKAKFRSYVFIDHWHHKLNYTGSKQIKSLNDLVANPSFRYRTMGAGAGGARVPMVSSKFDDWSLSFEVTYDDTQLDLASLKAIATRAFTYGGLGKWRPTFGRAVVSFK